MLDAALASQNQRCQAGEKRALVQTDRVGGGGGAGGVGGCMGGESRPLPHLLTRRRVALDALQQELDETTQALRAAEAAVGTAGATPRGTTLAAE